MYGDAPYGEEGTAVEEASGRPRHGEGTAAPWTNTAELLQETPATMPATRDEASLAPAYA